MASPSKSSREGYLEKKITLLDRRLTLLERFVETKFSEKPSLQRSWKILLHDDDDGPPHSSKARGGNAVANPKSSSSPNYVPRRHHPDPVDDDDRGESDSDRDYDNSGDSHAPTRSAGANSRISSDNYQSRKGMKVPERSPRSRAASAAPLSVKRRLMGTEKVPSSVGVQREGLQQKGTSRRRYNTRSKGKSIEIENLEDDSCSNVEEETATTTSVQVELNLEKYAKDENESCDDAESEGHYYPDGLDAMDDANENYDDEDRGPTGTPTQPEDEEPENSGLDFFTSDEDSLDSDEDEAYRPHKKKAKSSTGNAAKSRTKTKRNSLKGRGEAEESPAKPRVYAPADLVSIVREDGARKQCPECHKYIKRDWFHKHVNAHFKERNLKCPYCDKSFYCLTTLKKHTMLHQPEIYGTKCRICEKTLPRVDKALAHERICVTKTLERKEHVDPDIIDDIKRRSQNWTLKIPLESDGDPNELKECPHCQKLYKASFYPQHMRTHTAKQEWACSLCDKAYFHRSGLQRHFASVHQLPTCELCSKTFPERKDLIIHVLECRKKQPKDSVAESRNTSTEGAQVDADVEDSDPV